MIRIMQIWIFFSPPLLFIKAINSRSHLRRRLQAMRSRLNKLKYPRVKSSGGSGGGARKKKGGYRATREKKSSVQIKGISWIVRHKK